MHYPWTQTNPSQAHFQSRTKLNEQERQGSLFSAIGSRFPPMGMSPNPKLVHMHLDVDLFKLKPCPQNMSHNHKKCPYYHNPKDRKRAGDFYSGEICPFVEKNQDCPYGDECTMSHNRVEQLVFIIFGLS